MLAKSLTVKYCPALIITLAMIMTVSEKIFILHPVVEVVLW